MQNGEKQHPTISVQWNEQLQDSKIDFDPAEFRSWDMVMNVLETALRKAKDQRAVAMVQHMQRMQQEALAGNVIRKNLGL